MKLVLYSGGTQRENQALASEVNALLQAKRKPVIAFVPWAADDAGPEFRDFQRKMKDVGASELLCLPIDARFTRAEEKRLFACDAIFLGGGNTFYFLHQLRTRRLLEKFRAYVKKGGILMGLSAGSILMTPSVMMAQVPHLDSDDNDVGITNLKALDLVPFEFSPHYYPSRRADSELLAHSRKVEHPIYACADGEGIVVRDGSIRFIGRVTAFHRGQKFSLQ